MQDVVRLLRSDMLNASVIYTTELAPQLPSISGIYVQMNLVRIGKWLPIIIITGHDTPDSRARAFAGGAVAYLLKPVDDHVLLDAIVQAVSNPKP